MRLFIFMLSLALCTSYPILGGYESLDPRQARSDPQIQSLLRAGLEKVVDAGQQKGEFSSSNFDLYKLNSIYKQQGNEDNYKIDCAYLNDEGYAVDCYYEISYKPDDNNTTVTDYSYKVKRYSGIDEIEGLYTQVTAPEFENSNEIQTLVIYGANQFIKSCIDAGTLPDDQYRVSQFNWIYRQVYENSFFYKCNLYIVNEEGKRAEANYTVYYQPLINDYALVDYSCIYGDGDVYVISGTVKPVDSQYSTIPDVEKNYETVKNALNYGYEEVARIASDDGKIPNTNLEVLEATKGEHQIVGNGVYYKFACKLGDNNGVTLTIWFTVYYDYYASKYNLISYSYETDITGKSEGKEIEVETETETEIEVPVEEAEIEVETEVPQQDETESIEAPVNEEEQVEEGEAESSEDEKLSIFNQFFPLPDQESEEEGDTEVVNVPEQDQEQEQEQEQVVEEPVIDETEQESVNVEGNGEENVIIEPIPELQGQTFPIFGLDTEEENNIEVESSPEQEQEQVVEEPVIEEGEQENGNVENIEEEEVASEGRPQLQGEGWEGFEELGTNESSYDSETSEVLQSGFDTVVKQGKEEDKIPEYNYNIDKITRAGKRRQDEGNFYKFNCEGSSEEGSKLTTSFTVFYAFNTQEVSMVSYKYEVKDKVPTTVVEDTISTEGEYTKVDQDEIGADETIQGAVNYGVSQMYGYVAQQEDISISGFSLDEIVNVYKQDTVTGSCYKCEVILENKDKGYIKANYTVYYDSDSGQYSVAEYDYDWQGSEDDGTEEEENAGDDSYENISADAWEYDDYYKEMLEYAITVIIRKGYKSKQIPESGYKITDIISAEKKQEDNDNYYKCTVQLQDVNKVVITIKFTVSITITTRRKKLWDWSYDVSNRKSTPVTSDIKISDATYTKVDTDYVKYDQEIQNCMIYGVDQIVTKPQDYSLSKINSVYSQVVDNSVYYKYDVELGSQDKECQFTCTVAYRPDIGTKDVVAYYYKDKPSSSSTSYGETGWWSDASWSSGPSSSISSWNTDYKGLDSYNYEEMNVDDVRKDPKYQELLDYGVKECVENLYDYKVIESKDYDVDEVVDAYKQEYNDYENCQMGVTLKNKHGVTLELKFNVQYDRSYEKTITSYSVKGYYDSDESQVVMVNYKGEEGGQYEIENCQTVYDAEVEASPYLKEIVDYGVGEVIDQVTEKENIAYKDFKVKEVKNVYQEMADSNKYWVYASLENSQGKKIDCSVVVNYQPKEDKKNLDWYSYITY